MTRESGLFVENAGYSAGGRRIVSGVSFALPRGSLCALIGPNGAGKTTLLSLILGLLPKAEGRIAFGSDDLRVMPRQRRAQKLAFVEQSSQTEWLIDCRSVVMLGRIPFQPGWIAAPSGEDEAIVSGALAAVEMSGFAGRTYRTLSGGEQQRIQIARALAQQPELLLLDEPTSHLDIKAQLAILRLLRSLAGQGLTILAAIHDINLAAAYFDHLLVMQRGELVAEGPPETTLTAALLHDVYGIDADVAKHPRTGRIVIHPLEAAGP